MVDRTQQQWPSVHSNTATRQHSNTAVQRLVRLAVMEDGRLMFFRSFCLTAVLRYVLAFFGIMFLDIRPLRWSLCDSTVLARVCEQAKGPEHLGYPAVLASAAIPQTALEREEKDKTHTDEQHNCKIQMETSPCC